LISVGEKGIAKPPWAALAKRTTEMTKNASLANIFFVEILFGFVLVYVI
jgi:hypothetical protein